MALNVDINSFSKNIEVIQDCLWASRENFGTSGRQLQHCINSFENKKGTFEKPFGSSWSFEILRFFRRTIKEFVSLNRDDSITKRMMFLLKKCLQKHTKQQTIRTEQKTDAW